MTFPGKELTIGDFKSGPAKTPYPIVQSQKITGGHKSKKVVCPAAVVVSEIERCLKEFPSPLLHFWHYIIVFTGKPIQNYTEQISAVSARIWK